MIAKEQLQVAELSVYGYTFEAWGDDIFAIKTDASPIEIANSANMLLSLAERLAGSCVEGIMIDKEDAMLAAAFLMRAAKAAYQSLLGEP